MKTENINGIEVRKFNEMERCFLRIYHPEDTMFTSFAEIKLVSKVLDLNGMDVNDLQISRNGVVNYYSDLMKQERETEGKHTDKEFTYMEAMQSATSVIDNLMYSKQIGE